MTQEPVHDLYLDLRGLACPLPVLKTRKALQALPQGHRVLVEATDPLASVDIPHFVAAAGHRLVSAETTGSVFRCIVEKA